MQADGVRMYLGALQLYIWKHGHKYVDSEIYSTSLKYSVSNNSLYHSLIMPKWIHMFAQVRLIVWHPQDFTGTNVHIFLVRRKNASQYIF